MRVVAIATCVAGAAVALFAASRTWVVVTQARPAPLPPLHEAKTGGTLALATALGGLAVAAAGALTVVRGKEWPGLAARYDRPSRPAGKPQTDAQVWDALDRGDDPTR